MSTTRYKRRMARKAAKQARKQAKRDSRLGRINARKAGKKANITARKSAKINRQNQRTARVQSRTDRRQIKADAGFWNPETIEARHEGIAGIVGSGAQGLTSGLTGGAGGILDNLFGGNDGGGGGGGGGGYAVESAGISTPVLIGGAVLVAGLIFAVVSSGKKGKK